MQSWLLERMEGYWNMHGPSLSLSLSSLLSLSPLYAAAARPGAYIHTFWARNKNERDVIDWWLDFAFFTAKLVASKVVGWLDGWWTTTKRAKRHIFLSDRARPKKSDDDDDGDDDVDVGARVDDFEYLSLSFSFTLPPTDRYAFLVCSGREKKELFRITTV